MAPEWTMGLVVPLSGSLGPIGRSVVQGAEIAMETHSETTAGLTVTTEDSGGDPDRAAEIAQTMIDDGASIIGGPISSDVTLAVRDVCEREAVPLVPAMGGNPEITRDGTRYTFRFSSSNRQSGLGTVSFFRSRDVARLAIIGADFSYPRAVTAAIEAFGPDRGLSLEAATYVPLGTESFEDAIESVDPGSVEGFFLPYPGREAVDLVRQLHDTAGFSDQPVLGDYSFGSAPYSRDLGAEILGTYNWGVDTGSADAEQLARRVHARYGTSTGVYHYFGYDVLGLTAAALARAAEPAPEALRDAVAGLEYDAISGWGVDFNENGRNDAYEMLVNVWVREHDDLGNEVVYRSGPLAVD